MVSVFERRRRVLTGEEWRAIERAEGFWQLAEGGYVSCRRVGADRHEIVGHQYVGRARFGDLEVRVQEKVPGALLALIAATTGAELRVEQADTPATEFDAISRHLMAEFTRAAGRYIADRRKPRYRYQDAKGPVLAGTLDMPATMRLHATGRLGLFAYRQGTVIRDEPLDRLVLAGLDGLDRAAPALSLDPGTIYDARWLAGALDEVRDERFLATSSTEFLALGDSIEREQLGSAADLDLARLAAVALLHRGFEPDRPQQGDVPRAWFVDLETLFEQAVRATLRALLDDFEVDRGERYERRMFSGGIDTSRTNPDLVVHRDRLAVAVGDVKYKRLVAAKDPIPDGGDGSAKRRKKEARSDIYQVLVHAASVESQNAFLVYAGDDTYGCRYLGRSATGCRTWTVQVRPRFIAEDLACFLRESGVVPE